MINASAAAPTLRRSPSTARWSMTRTACDDLEAEVVRLGTDLARLAAGGQGEETDPAGRRQITVDRVG